MCPACRCSSLGALSRGQFGVVSLVVRSLRRTPGGGVWGITAMLECSNSSDMIRPAPFGKIIVGLHILSGPAALVAFKKLHD